MRPPGRHRLTILLVYGSLAVGARIISHVVRFPEVSIVGQARDVSEAVTLISLEKPRLVIADLLLPHGKGLEVLRQAKNMPSPPLVLMTSDSPYPQDRRECIREGADYFLHLPHDIDDLDGILLGLAGADAR
jgi:DNA-binding NarL/FixJ family response regulator